MSLFQGQHGENIFPPHSSVMISLVLLKIMLSHHSSLGEVQVTGVGA